jgi:GT2 family glycosyltransferase
MPPRPKQAVDDDAADLEEQPTGPPPKAQVDVTAVLVSHDGARWLPEAVATLAETISIPVHVVCVDTGSTDGSAELLDRLMSSLMPEQHTHVLRLPRTTGYGEAVAAGLADLDGRAARTRWLWLLHDDAAVEPLTLTALLAEAEVSTGAAMLGAKARDWDDPRVLVEIGLTTDAAGHRETRLERREYDQGQHDTVRDVLAVGTAGALIRRDDWEHVGGLDPELPVFRDDLDLGWKLNAAGKRVVVVPDARIRHARAATTGLRDADASPGRATGVDRRHALFVMLAHTSALGLLGLIPRLVLATVLRSLGLLLTRQVAAAGDEWRALVGVFRRPAVLHQARVRRTALRTVAARDLRPLFASRLVRIRSRVSAVAAWLGGSGTGVGGPLSSIGDPGPGSGEDEFDEMPGEGSSSIRRLLARPGVQLALIVGFVTLLAERSLIFATGPLRGGALLAVPEGAGDLWRTYLTAWHDVSVGSGAPTPPGVAALAALSTITLGQPSYALDLLLLACVPLSAITAYLAASRLVRHLALRLWAAMTWALLPVATGTVAAGRTGAAAVQIGLPLLALWAGKVLATDPREGWWRAWSLGLGLAVLSAFAPPLWPVVALLLLLGAAASLVVVGRNQRALVAVLVAVVPALVLFPWSLQALTDPAALFAGPQLADHALPAWHLVLLSPGGPGLGPVLLTAGLVVAGLLGTVRATFRGLALLCWGVAIVGLVMALVLSRWRLDGQAIWPGVPLQVAALAVLVAALIAANGARTRLVSSSFGSRQLLAAMAALAAALVPVIAATSWVARGADGPLQRSPQQMLPAFAQGELASNPGLRALVLEESPTGRLAYHLISGDRSQAVAAGLRADGDQRRALAQVVADLASPRGSDAAEALSTRAVRFVALRGDSQRLAAVLDGQVGLVRRSSEPVLLWQVAAPSARVSILAAPLAARALAGDRAPTVGLLRESPPRALKAGQETVSTALPIGGPSRLLVLADAVDSRWQATVNGRRLKAETAWGWAQAFALPEGGGRLEIRYDQSTRKVALGTQLVLVVLVLVLSAPVARRGRGLESSLDTPEPTGARESRSLLVESHELEKSTP